MTSEQHLPRPLSATHPDDRLAFAIYEAFNTRDFDAMAAMCADDVEFVDKRPGLTTTVKGRDAQMEQLHVMTDLGMRQRPNTLLADRGAYLKLLEVKWSNRDETAPIDVDTLLLIEYSEAGSIQTLFVYEPSDLDAALAGLDARDAERRRQPSAL